MAVLLITYDLNKPGKDYNGLLGAIRSYGYAKLSESSYAIKTEKSAQTIFSYLKQFIDDNDNMYIINLKKPYAGYGPKAVNDWLDKNLPN